MNAETRSSKKEINRLLADDFMEISSTGVPTLKVNALNRIPDEVNPKFTQQDYQLRVWIKNIFRKLSTTSLQSYNQTTGSG